MYLRTALNDQLAGLRRLVREMNLARVRPVSGSVRRTCAICSQQIASRTGRGHTLTARNHSSQQKLLRSTLSGMPPGKFLPRSVRLWPCSQHATGQLLLRITSGAGKPDCVDCHSCLFYRIAPARVGNKAPATRATGCALCGVLDGCRETYRFASVTDASRARFMCVYLYLS